MKNKSILFTIVISIIATRVFAQTATDNTFTDPRDGQTYKTITIENPLKGTSVTWMAQNLNHSVPDSWSYDNDESYRNGVGLLYTWDAAKQACPTGWHLPSNSDWDALVNAYGGEKKAGDALKSVKGWNENGNGTNSCGFNALPGGDCFNNDFYDIGSYGYWWSSAEYDNDYVWCWRLVFSANNVVSNTRSKNCGLSVRCVKDE